MRLLRWVGVLWLLGALAWNARHAERFSLLDPAVLEHGPQPHHLVIAANAVMMTVPALIIIALSFVRPRRRGGPRVFAHSRHAHHVRKNEAELERGRRARERERRRDRETGTPERARIIDLPPELKAARADHPKARATVAIEKPAPRRRSVIER